MEWVETTMKTIEEAKDYLLDQLGVDEDEAEFEVLEEPKAGLFGRSRGAARVRARIMPKSPRGKDERRRAPKRKSSGAGSGTTAAPGSEAPAEAVADAAPIKPKVERERAPRPPREPRTQDREPVDPAPFIEPLREFLVGIAASASLPAEVTITANDEGDLEAALVGSQLGALIGPAGGVIDAIQELSRTFLQKEAKGGSAPRLKVDVGGYRADRRVALEAFTREIAKQVTDSGKAHAFEVMGSIDRKTIHDAVNDIDGVVTSSQGEDPDRYVVLSAG